MRSAIHNAHAPFVFALAQNLGVRSVGMLGRATDTGTDCAITQRYFLNSELEMTIDGRSEVKLSTLLVRFHNTTDINAR